MKRQFSAPLLFSLTFLVGGLAWIVGYKLLNRGVDPKWGPIARANGQDPKEVSRLMSLLDGGNLSQADFDFLRGETNSKDPRIRSMAFDDLAQVGPMWLTQARPIVEDEVNDPDPENQVQAGWHLFELNDKMWNQILKEDSNSPSVERRNQAAFINYARTHPGHHTFNGALQTGSAGGGIGSG